MQGLRYSFSWIKISEVDKAGFKGNAYKRRIDRRGCHRRHCRRQGKPVIEDGAVIPYEKSKGLDELVEEARPVIGENKRYNKLYK